MKRGIPIVLPFSMQDHLLKCVDELSHIETPWAPFDELRAVFANADRDQYGGGGKWRSSVPWQLLNPLLLAITRAKDTCNHRESFDYLRLAGNITALNERRSPIDRLADLGAA